MADYDRSISSSSAQGATLLELVDAVLARITAAEILREKYFQVRREREPSHYLTTDRTRADAIRILRRAYFLIYHPGQGAKR